MGSSAARASGSGGNLGNAQQTLPNAQSYDHVDQMDDVRRRSNERDARNAMAARPGVNDEHHGINLASIGEDNNYEENLSHGQDETDLTNSERQVEENNGNLRDNEEGGNGVQRRSSSNHQVEDNISEDEFDECEGSQAANSNISASPNDNINLASDD